MNILKILDINIFGPMKVIDRFSCEINGTTSFHLIVLVGVNKFKV